MKKKQDGLYKKKKNINPYTISSKSLQTSKMCTKSINKRLLKRQTPKTKREVTN